MIDLLFVMYYLVQQVQHLPYIHLNYNYSYILALLVFLTTGQEAEVEDHVTTWGAEIKTGFKMVRVLEYTKLCA